MPAYLIPFAIAAAAFVSACSAAEPDTESDTEAASAPEKESAAAEPAAPPAEDSPELSALRDTPVDGLYELSRGMAVGYVTADGRYLLEGDLIDLATGRQITEERRRSARKKVVEDAAERSITFGAEDAEHLITVFTDIDCGYCRKLHSEIEDYNDAGISIRYLLYPRSGQDSASYRKAVAVWCSEDRKAALTRAKQGEDPGTKSCDHPIDQHLLAGRQLGLRGTPMMVLPNGEVVQGYVPAQRLASRLSSEPAQEPVAAAQ